MKIVGLFFVVFGGLLITEALGLSGEAQLVGAIVGASTYVLLQIGAH